MQKPSAGMVLFFIPDRGAYLSPNGDGWGFGDFGTGTGAGFGVYLYEMYDDHLLDECWVPDHDFVDHP